MSQMEVSVIGAGYVGLVTGAGLSKLGHRVRVSESSQARLAMLEAGQMPIWEPGLEEVVLNAVAAGLLSFHADNIEVVKGADVVFLAVPTSPADDGSADLSIVDDVLREIGPHLRDETVVIIKSTVPPGSNTHFQEVLEAIGCQASLVSNPEFLSQGKAMAQFLNPDRIVIGSNNDHATQVVLKMYEALGSERVVTDPVSAELVKYAANTFLATKVSFVNALAAVCEEVGGNIDDVVGGMTMDPRIGSAFFKPGPGFGGSCLPKDTSALIHTSKEHGYDNVLLSAVLDVNSGQLRRLVAKVKAAVVPGGRVCLWGLTFKAGTDDLRDSPAIALAGELLAEGFVLAAYDPLAKSSMLDIHQAGDPLSAATSADAVVIATEWPEFNDVSLTDLAAVMSGDMIIDARNLLDPKSVRAVGLRYSGVGRPSL